MVSCYVDRPTSVLAFCERSLSQFAHREAVIDGEHRLTYADLNRYSRAVVSHWTKWDLKAGERIAIAVENRWEFVVTMLAALRMGLILVPLNVRSSARELLDIMTHCEASAVILETSVAKKLADTPAAFSPRRAISVGNNISGLTPFSELIRDTGETSSAHAPQQEDVAILLYTSGTTGRPKGATLTHLNIVHSCMHYVACYELSSADRSMLAVPISHVTGVVAITLAMLYAGGAVIMLRKFAVETFVQTASAERMTHTVMVPAMYNLCLLRTKLEDVDLAAWRVGVYGGAPMPQATIEGLRKAIPTLQLSNAYGSTETTSPTTLLPFAAAATRADSVGCVVPCGDVRVMDEHHNEVAPGHPGEVWIAGPMVVPGYWQAEDATAQNFVAGYWRSGDIGSMSSDGYLHIFDRMKDVINRGGYKVYSVEVENELTHHPHISEVAVVGEPDPVLGEKVRAVIHTQGWSPNEQELRDFCASRLAEYKIPDFFTFSEHALPRNAAGKLLKRTIRDQFCLQ